MKFKCWECSIACWQPCMVWGWTVSKWMLSGLNSFLSLFHKMINFHTFIPNWSTTKKWEISKNHMKKWKDGSQNKTLSSIIIGLWSKSSLFHTSILITLKKWPKCYSLKDKTILSQWVKCQPEKIWKSKTFSLWDWWYYKFVSSSPTFFPKFTTFPFAERNKSSWPHQRNKWITVSANKI